MPFYKYKDHNIFYEDQGSGHCLFFVHEWNSSSLPFRKLNQKYLIKKLRVVCLDLPGYGNSEFVEGLQFDDFSTIMTGLLDHLGIRKCSLMGFCLGSAIILNFYRKFPERVRFLILIEPLLNFPMILIPLLIPRFGVTFLKYMSRNRFLFSLVGKQIIGKDKGVNNQVFRGIGRNNPKVSEHYLKLLFRENNHSMIRSPTMDIHKICICISGRNTNNFFKKNAASILDHFNIRDSFVLNDTRHFALIERPVEISNIILNYLKNVNV